MLGEADEATVGRDLTALAEATPETALAQLDPQVPFAVIAMGRFGGGELSYASDLDVLFVYDGDAATSRAVRVAAGPACGSWRGATPAPRIYPIDADLRPEGRQGPLARSLDGYSAYFDRWAQTWERQAMIRARPVAGDPDARPPVPRPARRRRVGPALHRRARARRSGA